MLQPDDREMRMHSCQSVSQATITHSWSSLRYFFTSKVPISLPLAPSTQRCLNTKIFGAVSPVGGLDSYGLYVLSVWTLGNQCLGRKGHHGLLRAWIFHERAHGFLMSFELPVPSTGIPPKVSWALVGRRQFGITEQADEEFSSSANLVLGKSGEAPILGQGSEGCSFAGDKSKPKPSLTGLLWHEPWEVGVPQLSSLDPLLCFVWLKPLKSWWMPPTPLCSRISCSRLDISWPSMFSIAPSSSLPGELGLANLTTISLWSSKVSIHGVWFVGSFRAWWPRDWTISYRGELVARVPGPNASSAPLQTRLHASA